MFLNNTSTKNAIRIILTVILSLFIVDLTLKPVLYTPLFNLSKIVSRTIQGTLQMYKKISIAEPDVSLIYNNQCPMLKNSKKVFEDDTICIIQTQIYGDTTLVSYPKQINASNPPDTFFYSHGQNEILGVNLTYTNFILNQSKLYARHNKIFVVSNLQGNNWGSKTSIQELTSLVDFINKQFYTSHKAHLIAFSMGGMLAYRIAATTPNKFSSVTILAGTLPFDILTKTGCQNILKNNIRIFHGTNDINVPYNQSTKILIDFCKKTAGKTPNVILKRGFDHWQIGALGYDKLWNKGIKPSSKNPESPIKL